MTAAAWRIAALDLAAARTLARTYALACEIGYRCWCEMYGGPVAPEAMRAIQHRAYRLAPLLVPAELQERVAEIVALVELEAVAS